MRVISGKYKGRKLKGFDINGTRPTMNRVKESLFATINPYLQKRDCLDLFAGAGALGIEAISNGASSAVFVDNNKVVIDVLKENTKGIDNIEIVLSDYKKYIKTCNKKFDVIFLDPPYDRCLITKTINYIMEYNLLKDNGIIVCEFECEKVECNLHLIKEKRYGNKYIKIFQNNK